MTDFMKHCQHCPYQGGCSLCEICEDGSMIPEREQELKPDGKNEPRTI